jgi:hypothetical protein
MIRFTGMAADDPHLFVTLPLVNPDYISRSARFWRVLRLLEQNGTKTTLDRPMELR